MGTSNRISGLKLIVVGGFIFSLFSSHFSILVFAYHSIGFLIFISTQNHTEAEELSAGCRLLVGEFRISSNSKEGKRAKEASNKNNKLNSWHSLNGNWIKKNPPLQSPLTIAPSSFPGLNPDAIMYVLPIVLIFSMPLNLGFSSSLSKSQIISFSNRKHSRPCLFTSDSS